MKDNYKVEIPSIQQIQALRYFDELELHRMHKRNHIFRDFKGYFSYEVPFEDEIKTEKFYFEESYLYLEKKIVLHYQEAATIYQQLCNVDSKKQKDKIIYLGASYLKQDYLLYLFLDLYSGSSHYPFLSKRQIIAWIERQVRLHIFVDFLSSKDQTPLQAYKMITQSFKKYSKSIFHCTSSTKNIEAIRKNQLLKSIPYGMEGKE